MPKRDRQWVRVKALTKEEKVEGYLSEAQLAGLLDEKLDFIRRCTLQ
jgi:hypothetical protein